MMANWRRAKPASKCPICGSMVNGRFKSGCQWMTGRTAGTLYVICLRVSEGSFKTTHIAQFGRAGFHHVVQEGTNAHISTTFEAQRLDPIQTDAAYSKLLSGELTIVHRNYLLDSKLRNLNPSLINRAKYTTLGLFSDTRDAIAELISKQLTTEGVPGFWTGKNNEPKLSGPGGILLPVRNSQGLVTGCAINSDHAIVLYCRYKLKNQPIPESLAKQFPKYLWLTSSDRNKGTGVTASLHYPVQNRPVEEKTGIDAFIEGGKKYLVVEGILKSDIVSDLWKGSETVVGQPGSSACHTDIVSLAGSSKGLIFGFDSDWRTNKDFKATVRGLLAKLKKHEVLSDCDFLLWDSKYGKGLDDVLQSGNREQIDVMPAQKWLDL